MRLVLPPDMCVGSLEASFRSVHRLTSYISCLSKHRFFEISGTHSGEDMPVRAAQRYRVKVDRTCEVSDVLFEVGEARLEGFDL